VIRYGFNKKACGGAAPQEWEKLELGPAANEFLASTFVANPGGRHSLS